MPQSSQIWKKKAGPTRTTRKKRRRQDQQKTQCPVTLQTESQLITMASLYYFRRLCSKKREFKQHCSHCERTNARQAGSAKGRTVTWKVDNLE